MTRQKRSAGSAVHFVVRGAQWREAWRRLAARGIAAMATIGGTLLCASAAHAALGCVDLGGAVVGTECRVTSLQNKSGAYEIGTAAAPLSLHLVDGGAPASVGKIVTGGNDLSLLVHGKFLMDANTVIDASKSGCATGGKITINADADVTTKPQSLIRSNSCTGGEIIITSGPNTSASLAGTVESVGTVSGTGSSQRPGGGPITVASQCSLTVTADARISSRGGDPGADLVRLLGGCVVGIYGLVESIGQGHAVPNNPPNRCAVAPRNGKPGNSTACIEIIAGDQLVIDSRLPNNGEVRADTGTSGGSFGTSWIDAFVRGPILVIGDVNQPFSVHANGLAGTNDDGGTITFKSKTSSIAASGLAFQADATNPGGIGGTIILEAKQAVTLNDAQVFARGDFNQTGGFGSGGHVTVQSFKSTVAWNDTVTAPPAIGDVRPTGSALPLAKRGTIDLIACGTISTLGTGFPVNGSAVAPFPNVSPGVCPAAPNDSPGIPSYAGVTDTLPLCQCAAACICATGFFPATVGTNSTLTISGNGLAGASRVVLSPTCDPLAGGAVQAQILSQSGAACDPGSVVVQVPSAASGTYFVVVTSPSGASSCSAGLLTKQ